MSHFAATKKWEDLMDAEGGTQTIANLRAYYEAYVTEQNGNGAVSYEKWLAAVESYMRNSALAGAP